MSPARPARGLTDAARPDPVLAAPSLVGARYTSVDIALLVVLGLVWGAAYVFIRQGILLGASPLPYAAVRYALSAGAFGAIALVRRDALPRLRNLLVSASVGGVLVIGLYGGFLYWGEQYTSGGFASVLSTIVPILTLTLAYFVLPGDRLGWGSILGIAIGFGGTVVLVAPALSGGPGGGWEGTASVIGAFVSATIGSVLLRRFGGGRQSLWQIGAQFAVGSALLGGGSFAIHAPERLPATAGVWEDLAILVVFASVVGYFTYFALHHRVGPIRTNAVTYLLPVVGVGLGTGLYGEPVTVEEIVGGLIVLAGMTLVVRESLRRAGPRGTPPASERSSP
jgi:drug/metabolite transporter (DMT)-like permease